MLSKGSVNMEEPGVLEGNGFSWALCPPRHLKVIRRGEDSGPHRGLLCARPGPGTLGTLPP